MSVQVLQTNFISFFSDFGSNLNETTIREKKSTIKKPEKQIRCFGFLDLFLGAVLRLLQVAKTSYAVHVYILVKSLQAHANRDDPKLSLALYVQACHK